MTKRPLGRGDKDQTEVEKLRSSVKVAANEITKLNAEITSLQSHLANEERDNKVPEPVAASALWV